MEAEADEDLTAISRQRIIFNVGKLLEEITENSDHTLRAGATPEQIASGVKQWYAWYDRSYDRFKTKFEEGALKPTTFVDPLEDLIDIESMSPAERRRYLEDKKKFESGGR